MQQDQRTAAALVQSGLDRLGAEPLAGSGFEIEDPDSNFDSQTVELFPFGQEDVQ